jgi:hypothetical protein
MFVFKFLIFLIFLAPLLAIANNYCETRQPVHYFSSSMEDILRNYESLTFSKDPKAYCDANMLRRYLEANTKNKDDIAILSDDQVIKKEEEGTTPIAGTTNEAINEDYGVWNLEFSTEGSYNNFIKFTKDMEKNLRLVDIASVTFSAADGAGSSKSSIANDVYKYSFKIKTYWLKN